jgi:hypothetical protein
MASLAAPPAAAATAPLTVRSFFLQWAVGSARSLRDLFAEAGDSPIHLWHIATHSLRLEEAVASGCLLVQAVALVRLWTKMHGVRQIEQMHAETLTHWCT